MFPSLPGRKKVDQPNPFGTLSDLLDQLEAKTGKREAREDVGAQYRPLVELPDLHPGQHRMLEESRRYNVAVCGRRFGKTYLLADVLIDGPRKKGAIHGYPTALYAPTYQTMLESWRKLVQVLKPVTAKKSEADKRIDLVTGGSIEFWSLDNPDAGRGRKYATVAIDEAAMIKRLEEAWTQNIQPLLLDFQGEAWIVSTPKGDNYFKTLFDMGDARNSARDDQWISWQIPTWENPYISRDDIERMRQSMPRLAFMQEIEAQFVSFAGTFIKAEHLHSGQPPAGLRLYQGVDLAISMKENADYTAIVTVGRDEATGKIWIVDAERRRVGFRDALEFIKAKAARWQPQEIAIEAVQYQAAVVEELLRSTSLPVRQVRPDKDKLTRAQGLITRYENGLVWHSEALPQEFTNELLAFGPDCEHDDFVDAAVYAYIMTGDYKNTTFILPQGETRREHQLKAERMGMHGLPSSVVIMMESSPERANVCGRCSSYFSGECAMREMRVGENDVACDMFEDDAAGGEEDA